jgi:hypothetical protein
LNCEVLSENQLPPPGLVGFKYGRPVTTHGAVKSKALKHVGNINFNLIYLFLDPKAH